MKKSNIKEIEAKSILRKHKKIDSWFVSRYGMNLYRGCIHNCVYCDGRAEKYQVDGEFGQDVSVKTNAIEILKKELDPRRKRIPLKPGYIMLGGGVGDSYQPAEQKYQLSRRALELMIDYQYPVHILTKSTLVKKDVDLIRQINEQKRAIVSFSFSSVDEKISGIFEPGVPSPGDRLETISYFKDKGIACGMFLMPVLPFISDKIDALEESIERAKSAGVDFIIFSGMTLKEGRQKDYFLGILQKYYSELLEDYGNIYKGDKWGGATAEYYDTIHQRFHFLAKKYRVPMRIPPYLWLDYIDENDRVIVVLEHIDYLLKTQGKKSPYGFAAYSISKLKQPISTIKHDLQKLKGVGQTTERIIQEIIKTGISSYYNRLMNK
jgi:DNA repair photolyase